MNQFQSILFEVVRIIMPVNLWMPFFHVLGVGFQISSRLVEHILKFQVQMMRLQIQH